MSKAILKFNLPEEQEEFEMALNATKYCVVLHNIDQTLRNKIKYADENATDEYINTLQMIRDELWMFIEENDISI
ncbi:MAG: hypothetical protein EBU90_01260 [Proteobacteria bacterium]|nr:hypothetical protein [Pseudomonadota bacterium]NBP12789.1 hypothetical protein [bacterium]